MKMVWQRVRETGVATNSGKARAVLRGAALAFALGALTCGDSGDSDNEALVLGSAQSALSAAPYDWMQFHGDSSHAGNNTSETILSAQNVAALTQLFKVTLPATADGAPVVLTGVSTGSGVRDLVFSTTQAG